MLEQNNISLVSSVHLEFQLRLKQEAAAEVILPAPYPQASCHGHLPPPTAFTPASQYPPQQSAPVESPQPQPAAPADSPGHHHVDPAGPPIERNEEEAFINVALADFEKFNIINLVTGTMQPSVIQRQLK